MSVEIKRTKKDNIVDVYRKGEFLGELSYDKEDKTFAVTVGGSNYDCANYYYGFPTKEKAIGKMLHYYGYAK